MKTQEIKVGEIIVDDEIQSRTGLNEQYINEYHEEVERGVQFPPVELFFDGQYYFLTDGFHRHQAFKKAGKKTISAIIHKGDRRKAILYSVGVNANHGIRRTNEDKQKVVRKLLDDDVWSKWSDGEVAKRCAVSQPFVSKVRRELTQNGIESPPQRKGADGRIIDTSNIGKDPKSPKEQSSSEEGSHNGVDEAQADSAEVEMEFPEKTDSPKPKKASKSSGDEDKKGDDAEEDTVDLLTEVTVSIAGLFSGLTEINNLLPKERSVTQKVLDRLDKPLQKLRTTWTQFISDITEMIDD